MFPLTIPKRIGLSVAAFIIPLAVLLCFFVQTINEQIHFTQLEREGMKLLSPLLAELDIASRHQSALTQTAIGAADRREALTSLNTEMQTQIGTLAAVVSRVGEDLQLTPEGLRSRGREQLDPEKVKNKWYGVAVEGGKQPPAPLPALTAGYDAFLADIRGMIAHVGDTSNLIRDPDLDSYSLMDAVLLALPRTIDRLRQLEAEIIPLLLQPEPTAVDTQIKLAAYAAMLKEADQARIRADMDTSFKEDPHFYGVNPTLKSTIEPKLAAYNQALGTLLKQLEQIQQGVNPPVATFAGMVADTRAASLELWKTSSAELNKLLTIRMMDKVDYRTNVLLAFGVAVLLGLGLFVFIAHGITRRKRAVDVNTFAGKSQAINNEIKAFPAGIAKA